MVNFEGKYDEYIESGSVSDVSEIEKAKTIAKLDEVEKVEKEITDQTESLRKGMLETKGKVDFTVPDSINHFYRIEGGKPVFQLNKVKEYLDAVFKRLSGKKTPRFGDISKENNFTGTVLAIQIALKAMESDTKSPKKYGIGKINGKYDDTVDAIKQFQSEQNMRDIDGKPGKNTIGLIVKSLEKLINNRKEYYEIKDIVKSNITGKIGILDSNSKSDEIADYLIKGKLGSNSDSDLEKEINDLADGINNPLGDDLRNLIKEYKDKGKLIILNNDERFSNTKYDNLIVQFSKKYSDDKYQIDPALMKILMYKESRFREKAFNSGSGAAGLMQLTKIARDELKLNHNFSITKIYSPIQNIEGGIKLFRTNLETFNGNIPLALAAYNAGPNRVKSAGNKIPKTKKNETENYVKFITTEYDKLKA